MSRPEELNDPKKFDVLMEDINTKLAIAAIPLRERALMSQALLCILRRVLEGVCVGNLV